MGWVVGWFVGWVSKVGGGLGLGGLSELDGWFWWVGL